MAEKKKNVVVKANEFVFSFTPEEIEQTDFYKKSPTEFNLIKNNRSVNARLLDTDVSGKHLKIEVEGETYELDVKDELDQMLDKMGFSTVSNKHVKEIKAPMPGLVLSIAVEEGQEVLEGDKILILEAMKMENSIMIHANAKIKKIKVKPGQPVDKNQVLVELE
ncbi:MAG: biotin/lipoyl-binding protein [Chitinophagaceae bacterium]|nr:biotin/lipoyl-binding protein [Chitinophagaceae bacterium]MBK8953111.1 biotin/lipoyl-binding protein [Chitinophagaceae bacterium]